MTAYLPPPDMDDALVTAGMLCHFVARVPGVADQLARWVEHCPGDLDAATIIGYLAQCHDLLAPTCGDPITADPRRDAP